jgi:hypothetical protein
MQTSDVELTLISINRIIRFHGVTDLTKKVNFREVKITVAWDVTLLCQTYVLFTGTHVTDSMVSHSRRPNLSTDH